MNTEAIDWAFDRPITNSADKLVLLAIARRANKHWAAFPGKAEIAGKTGLAERSIAKCVKRLEDGGHLLRIAFAGTSGQDQKIGYVLAGCGRLPDGLDEAFLALAFANRKQIGIPLAAKPQHWSGERTGEGRQPATRGGSPGSDPEGGRLATPRSKEHTEDHKEQEDAFGEARDKSLAREDPAIAEVGAAAPARTRGSSTGDAARIPKQRTPRPSNERRDADWRAQIAAADVDELNGAAGSMSVGPDHYNWACRQAAYRLGFGTEGKVPDGMYPEYIRTMYLCLLKEVAAVDPDHLDELKYPLDGTIKAGKVPFRWHESMYVPDGETVESFSTRMLQAAAQMTSEQVGLWTGEIDDFVPGLWYEKRQEARAQIRVRKLPLEIETIGLWTARLMIQHYADKPTPKWPMKVVPPSMRPTAMLATSEPPPWAA